MSQTIQQPYERIDLEKVEADQAAALRSDAPAAATPGATAVSRGGLRWTVIPISIVLCIAQAVLAIITENTANVVLTPTLISVIAFGVLFLLVLLVNPVLRLVFRGRVLKPLSRIELTSIFAALLVTSGISTFGLSSQVVPIIAAPWNPAWNTPQRGWSEKVLPNLNPKLYLTIPDDPADPNREEALQTMRVFREGLLPVDADGNVVATPSEDDGWGVWLPYYWLIFKQVPWGAWVPPLMYWLIFIGGCYLLFYSLTYVVLGYWSNREKLIFPLARLPETLLPEDGSRGWIPPALKSPGFWAFFAVSFGVLTWNAGVTSGVITGLGRITLGMGFGRVEQILRGTILEGLTGGEHQLVFLFLFTAIGIAFLLPVEISFSTWFYFLIGKLFILFAVWMGHGQTGKDFPRDWLWDANMVSAQGAGGMIVFAGISLWRCILDFLRLGRGKSIGHRVKLAMPVVGLAVSIVIVTLWLKWNNLPIIWAFAVTLFLTLLTLGLMRLVAEGGIYWFQAHSSFFHFYKAFGLGASLKAALLAPLLPIYYVLFLDIKTFIAPNILNAAKMKEDVEPADRQRFKFHLNIILCVAVSVIVALGFTIFLAHVMGSNRMQGWFHSGGPQNVLDRAYRAAAAEPEFNPVMASWYGAGGLWVALSMFLRRTLFWFPHPIGYIMLINPLIAQLWLSFFIGWACKRVVVKYGGKSTFDKTQPMFIGLIMGELMAIFIWTLVGLAFDVQTGLSLNRYGP